MTGIQWTDETWNPIVGCSRVSPGCTNCYAAAMDRRIRGKAGEEYRDWSAPNAAYNVRLHPERLEQPLRWRKPRRVFVNSMSDLFHEQVPDEYIDSVFATMALTPQHTYQVLTKRPARMRAYLTDDVDVGLTRKATRASKVLWAGQDSAISRAAGKHLASRFFTGEPNEVEMQWPLPNVWLGVSVEDQRRADERIPVLLDTPAAVRFLSCEPLLSGLDLERYLHDSDCAAEADKPAPLGVCICNEPREDHISWVIVGGESGPGARVCDVEWIRDVVQQCRAAGVAPFVKQLGANVRDRNDAGFDADEGIAGSWPMGTKHNVSASYQGAPVRVFLRHGHGGDPEEWPADLRVREFPQ